MLTTKEANIRAKLTQIQTSLTPHMEILHKELGYAKTLLKKDPNLSTLDGLVHLAAKLDIQVKSLDVACDNWDEALKIIMEVHQYFLEKGEINKEGEIKEKPKGESKIEHNKQRKRKLRIEHII